MSKLTLYKVRNRPWKLWPMLGLIWASTWQILEPEDPPLMWVSIANMVGCLFVLVSMVITNKETSKAVERWAYLGIVWSMSIYLSFAVSDGGWTELIRSPNLGVVLSEAVVLAAIHTVVWGWISRYLHRHRVKCEAQKLIAEAGPA